MRSLSRFQILSHAWVPPLVVHHVKSGSGEAKIPAFWTLVYKGQGGCTRVHEDVFKGKETKPARSAHGSGKALLPKGVIQCSDLFILKLRLERNCGFMKSSFYKTGSSVWCNPATLPTSILRLNAGSCLLTQVLSVQTQVFLEFIFPLISVI